MALLLGLIGLGLTAAEPPKANLPRSEAREITVVGAVNNTGKLVLPAAPGNTLVVAITRSGGFTRYAMTHRIVVTRKNEKREESYTVDFSEQTKEGAKPFELQPGDVVFVPERVV